jgi:hypothetical protein
LIQVRSVVVQRFTVLSIGHVAWIIWDESGTTEHRTVVVSRDTVVECKLWPVKPSRISVAAFDFVRGLPLCFCNPI